MSGQKAAEEFKIMIAEQSRDNLISKKVREEQPSLEKKNISAYLPHQG